MTTWIPRRFRFLPLLVLFAITACDGGPSGSTAEPDDATLDFGGHYDGQEVVLERVTGEGPDGPYEIDLVALDVSVDPEAGVVALDVALRNRTNRALGLPAIVFVGDFTPDGTVLTNADNMLVDPLPGSEPPQGPYDDWYDYGGTFGDDGRLAPGETSDPRVWRVAVGGGIGSFSFGAHVRIGLDGDRPYVGGRVFDDENLNGRYDDFEMPFGAGMVELRGPDGTIQRTTVGPGGGWRVAIRRAGLYTARWIDPPRVGPMPLCVTTPNPLEVAVVPGADGRPMSFDQANFGVHVGPCPPRDDVVRLTSAPPDSIPTDSFRLIDARVIASPEQPDLPPTTWFVEVRVGFSGCSPDHPFALFAGDDFIDTNPPITWLRFSHYYRRQLC